MNHPTEQDLKDFDELIKRETLKMQINHRSFMRKMIGRLFWLIVLSAAGLYLCKQWEIYAIARWGGQ